MNILNILEEVEKVDGEIYERLNPRRKAMKDFYGIGKKIALAAVPLALGSMFTKAYGQNQTPTQVNDVLNFALSLEYLEFNFYNHALVAAPGLIPAGAATAAITTIRDHEQMHVNLFKTAAGALAFEDTGVRAFKGQAVNLKGNAVLTTALRVHAVEARHAAHIRGMIATELGAKIAPWISLGPNGISNDTGVAAADMSYAGENIDTQAGITITGINGISGITKAKAVECFDEPLDRASVITIANLFLKPGAKLA